MDRFHSGKQMTEGRGSKLNNSSVESIQSEQELENRHVFEKEQILRYL